MKEIKTCADGNGDLVFDVWGPQGCKDKASGLSNNFAAQQWCKDGNTRSGNCWIPYSLQLNEDDDEDDSTSCFPLDKDRSGQWTGERREREREAVRMKTKSKVQSNSGAMNAPSFANRFVRRC